MIISLQTEGDVSSQTLRAKEQTVKKSAQAVWYMESADILPEYPTELFMTAQCEADAEAPSGNVFYSPRYLQENPELMGTYESARIIAVTFSTNLL